jgi:hypothetical protein
MRLDGLVRGFGPLVLVMMDLLYFDLTALSELLCLDEKRRATRRVLANFLEI